MQYHEYCHFWRGKPKVPKRTVPLVHVTFAIGKHYGCLFKSCIFEAHSTRHRHDYREHLCVMLCYVHIGSKLSYTKVPPLAEMSQMQAKLKGKMQHAIFKMHRFVDHTQGRRYTTKRQFGADFKQGGGANETTIRVMCVQTHRIFYVRVAAYFKKLPFVARKYSETRGILRFR